MEREERVDVDALMEEVRKRVEDRKRAGGYGKLDDSRPFAELATEDELAASANRLAAIAQLPGVAPDLLPRAPGSDSRGARSGGDGGEEARPASPASIASAASFPPPVAGLTDRALEAARRVVARVAGERVESFVRSVGDYFLEAADNARVVAERLIALERRVAELEAEKKKTPAAEKRKPAGSAPKKPAPRRRAPSRVAADSARSKRASPPPKRTSRAQSGASGASKASKRSPKTK